MRRLLPIAAAVGVLFLAFPVVAGAKSYVLKHPKHEHCKASYTRKVETLGKRREHHRMVKVKDTVCVHVKAKKAPSATVETPSSTETTTTTPVTTTTLAVHPGACSGPGDSPLPEYDCSYGVEATATGVPSGFEGIELWLIADMPWEELEPSARLVKVPYRPVAGVCTITLRSWRESASGTRLFASYGWSFEGSAGCPGDEYGKTQEWWSPGFLEARPGGYEEPMVITWALNAYTPGEDTVGGDWTGSESSGAQLTVTGATTEELLREKERLKNGDE